MPLFWFCLAIIIGIFTASNTNISVVCWVVVASTAFLGSIFEFALSNKESHPLLSRPLFRIPIFLILFAFSLGGLRFQSALPDQSFVNLLNKVNSSPITLTGMISSDPYRSSSITFAKVKSESIKFNRIETTLSEQILLLLPVGPKIHYGDRIELYGNIAPTYDLDTLPINSRMARRKVFAQMPFPNIEIISMGTGNPVMEVIYKVRNHAHETIYNLMPFPESAVLSGILLGIEGGIPEYLWDSYIASSTIHVIAISGFNISIIALLISSIFKRILNWKWTLIASAGTVLVYTLLVGAEPPVVRAAIMGVIALPAYQIGRRIIGIHNLTLAAAVMLMFNPFSLWDTSFQLSFLATLSLLTMVDPIDCWISQFLERYLSENKIQGLMPVITMFTSTLAASIAIFPILFSFESRVSSISLVANFLIIPVQPIIMVTGGLATIFGMILPAIGRILGAICWPFIAFCNQVAIRLSMGKAAMIFLPDFAFWISLFLSITSLVLASVHQILSLNNPKDLDQVSNEISENNSQNHR